MQRKVVHASDEEAGSAANNWYDNLAPHALVVVARRRASARGGKVVVVVAGQEEGRRKRAREGGRTSGPTPVSESDIQAVAQRCGDSAVTVRRVWWVHVEVRKGKERSR